MMDSHTGGIMGISVAVGVFVFALLWSQIVKGAA